MLEQKLLELLVCPVTKGALIYKPTQNELWSREAGLAYAVRDDIPVLIAADARTLNDDELAALNDS